MKLLPKTVGILVATSLVGFLLLYATLYSFIQISYTNIEQQYLTLNLQRARSAVDDELNSMALLNRDWANWDDSYQFMYDHNQKYIDANLPSSIFESVKLYAIAYVDREGRVVWGGTYDQESGEVSPLTENLLFQLAKNQSVWGNSIRGLESTGLILLPEGPALLSACPILTTAGQGPAAGTLAMVRLATDKMTAKLNHVSHLSFSLTPVDLSSYNPVSADTTTVKIEPVDDKVIKGSIILEDIYGKPQFLLTLDMPRTIYSQGLITWKYFAVVTAITLFLFCLLILVLFHHYIVRRVTWLSNKVNNIGSSGDLSTRISLPGDDEISGLASRIDEMLEQLECSQRELVVSKSKYQQLFDDAPSGNYISTPEGQLILCNTGFARMLGYKSTSEVISTSALTLYPRPEAREEFLQLLQSRHKLHNFESILMTKNGEEITVLENVTGIFDNDGNLVQIQGYMIDISQRKQTEESVKYLSLHDSLTGLYNRFFLEEMFKKLDTEDNLPLSLIMLDVNGLKLINDALGHQYGDELLIAVADCINSCCRKEDIICRWGGDEYLIMLPGTSESSAQLIAQRIRQSCENIVIQGIHASSSLGVMSKTESNQDLMWVLKEAEEKMYRYKLLERNSNRNAFIQTLEASLRNKSYETAEHFTHLDNLLTRLGKAIQLKEDELDDLCLLAALHDIGKIAIPDDILNKPAPLTPEEWSIVKKHSEIGYRIAKSSPELDTLAEAILCHHERWDGKGYPLGFKGKSIPLYSRMIAIVHAYDVMTSERTYRASMAPAEALAELRKYSGKQFDPELVEVFISMFIHLAVPERMECS